MNDPLISILLPVKNGSETILKSIQSMLDQTVENFELIIIFNGTNDGSDILVRNSVKDDRIKFIHLDFANLVIALNAGLNIAQGKFIARMDVDDYSLPTRFERQLEYFKMQEELGVVATQVSFTSSIKRSEGIECYTEWQNNLISHEDIYLSRFIEAPIIHPTVMIRKEFLTLHGGWKDGNFPEDYELWLRLLSKGIKFKKVPEKLLVWHDHDLRLTRTDKRYSESAFYKIKSSYLASWLKINLKGRPLYILGAGKKSRNRLIHLEKDNISFEGFIDVDSKKCNQKLNGLPVFHYKEIDNLNSPFFLSYVGGRGQRDLVTNYLEKKGFMDGMDFLIVS